MTALNILCAISPHRLASTGMNAPFNDSEPFYYRIFDELISSFYTQFAPALSLLSVHPRFLYRNADTNAVKHSARSYLSPFSTFSEELKANLISSFSHLIYYISY